MQTPSLVYYALSLEILFLSKQSEENWCYLILLFLSQVGILQHVSQQVSHTLEFPPPEFHLFTALSITNI